MSEQFIVSARNAFRNGPVLLPIRAAKVRTARGKRAAVRRSPSPDSNLARCRVPAFVDLDRQKTRTHRRHAESVWRAIPECRESKALTWLECLGLRSGQGLCPDDRRTLPYGQPGGARVGGQLGLCACRIFERDRDVERFSARIRGVVSRQIQRDSGLILTLIPAFDCQTV